MVQRSVSGAVGWGGLCGAPWRLGCPRFGFWAVLGEKLRGLEGTVPCLAAYSESAGSDLGDPHIKLGNPWVLDRKPGAPT